MPRSQNYAPKSLQGYGGTAEITACRRSHCIFCFDARQKQKASLRDSLIRSFASRGSLLEANLVFCTTSQPSIHTWDAIIFAHAAHGQHHGVLELYRKMQEEGVELTKFVFPSIIKSCSALGALQQGKLVHDDILRYAVECDGIIGCTLLDMYARCGRLDEARNLLDNLSKPNVVAWGAMMTGYAQHKQGLTALKIFEEMQKKGLKPTNITFLSAIKSCSSIGAIAEGNLIHDHIVRLKFESDIAIVNALIDMYAKCGSLDAAQNGFDRASNQDVMSYSALIDAYVQHGHSFAALQIYERMQQKCITTCIVTYLCVLKACCNIGALQPGMVLHKDIIVNDAETDVSSVANTLIDMYGKCGCLDEARRVFDLLPGRSTVSWGAMSAGYIHGGQSHRALELYEKMQKEGVKADNGTYVTVLKACGNTGSLARGKAIHKQMVDSGISLDTVLGSTLIDMYAKCGDLKEAEQVFSALPRQDVVSWSALITGHVNLGQHAQALELFKRMQHGVKPDTVIFLCVIKACRSMGALNEGKMVHHLAKRHGFESDLIVASALIDMYAKCGNMEEARQLFDGLLNRDAVAWGAIITGYAHNGDHEQVKKCTEEMRRQGVMPIGAVPSHVLSACTLSANMDEGQDLFKDTMRDAVDRPSVEHYNSAIDLFGRAGDLKDAQYMLQSMPIPADVVGWTALLTSCNSHGNSTLGKECYKQISQLDPNGSFGHSLLSKLYADAGMWDELHSVQEERKSLPVFKKPGKAWIEVHNGVHEFVVQDASHTQSAIMYASLSRVTRLLKQEGYVPQINVLPEQGVQRKPEVFLQSDVDPSA